MSTADHPHVLYRLFSEDSELLYIGITQDFDTRLKTHLSTTMPEGSRVRGWATIQAKYARHHLEPFPDRATAHAAEKAAIRAEHPTLNVHYNTGAAEQKPKLYNAKADPPRTPSSDLLETLAYVIGREMSRAGFNVNGLADAACVSRQTLAREFVTGNFKYGHLHLIAQVLGTVPSELIREAESERVAA